MKTTLHKLFLLLLILTAGKGLTAQTTITHNIATGNLIIAGNSPDNYIITGTTTTYYVEVQTGYKGAITLKNVNITLGDTNVPYPSPLYYRTPFTVRGQNKCSNLTPVTNVDIILEGNNIICFTGRRVSPAFQVEQGSQINISENPCIRGTLSAIVTQGDMGGGGGAGIGAREQAHLDYQATDSNVITGCVTTPAAGGNVVISSGTITAQGGHGAGIGGGHFTFYDGMIVIYGGTVNASSLCHSAGLGSGCPTGSGVISCYTPNSAVIVLPPAQISATGAGNVSGVPVASLALAGTNKIIYIGDTAKPLITVHTDDYEPYADIYVDLSLNPDIAGVFNAIIPQNRFDITKVKFGQTNASGLFQFHGTFNNNTTFFTDAISSQPSTLGRPYSPETVQMSNGGTVVLKRMPMNISLFPFPSIPLAEGYVAPQAFSNAYRIKITYNDAVPMTNIVFDIAGGAASDFSTTDIKFYASDSTTLISPPTTLSRGNTIYAVIPLKTGKLTGYYTDIFRFTGNWNGSSTGYIRQTVGQAVYVDNTQDICEGDSVLLGTKYYKLSGVYYDTLQNVNGCDSIVTLILTVNPIYSSIIYDTICQGDSISFCGKYYNQTGIYSDTLQTVFGCDSIITLNLHVNLPDTFTIYDTICPNTAYAQHGFTIPADSLQTAGTFEFKDTLSNVLGCDSIITLQLTVRDLLPLSVNLGNDTTICWLDSLILNAKHINANYYQWQDGSTGYTYTIYYDGQYWVIITNLCSEESDTINVSYLKEINFNMGKDTIICEDIPIYKELNVTSPYASYLWQDGSTSPVYIIEKEGIYSVTVSNACMSVSKSIEIKTMDCRCELWLPNIFSPNNDGLNEIYLPVVTQELLSFQMVIYNRWGGLIFSTNTFKGWDGKMNGKDVPDGVYYCVVEYYCKDNPNKKRTAQSSVTVVR